MILRNRLWNQILSESEERLQRLSQQGYVNRMGLLPEVAGRAQTELNTLRQRGDGPIGMGLLKTIKENLQHQPPKEEPEEEQSQEIGKLGRRPHNAPPPGSAHSV